MISGHSSLILWLMIGIALYGKKKFLSSVNTFKSNFFNSPSVEKASTRSHSLLTNAVYRGEPSIGITSLNWSGYVSCKPTKQSFLSTNVNVGEKINWLETLHRSLIVSRCV